MRDTDMKRKRFIPRIYKQMESILQHHNSADRTGTLYHDSRCPWR